MSAPTPGRLAAVAAARRTAGDLRRHVRPVRQHQPDAAVSAAVPDHRLVRRHRFRALQSRAGPHRRGRAAGDRQHLCVWTRSAPGSTGWRRATCSARSWSSSDFVRPVSFRSRDRCGGAVSRCCCARLRAPTRTAPRDLCGAVARRVGPLLPAAPHRPRQPARRVSRPGRRLDRGDPARRMGKSRPRRRRICASGPAVGLRPGRIPMPAASRPTTSRCSASCWTTASRRSASPRISAIGNCRPSWRRRTGCPPPWCIACPTTSAVAREIARIRAPLMGRLIRTRAQARTGNGRGARPRRASRHAGGPAFLPRGGRHVLRPALQGQSDDRAPGAAVRLPGCRRAGDPPARRAASGSPGWGRSLCRGTPSGRVDVPATTQMITSIVEGWIREHPDQWLWFHRRWR